MVVLGAFGISTFSIMEETKNAYDLRNSVLKKSFSQLDQEAKYDPRPYDLSFVHQYRKATN